MAFHRAISPSLTINEGALSSPIKDEFTGIEGSAGISKKINNFTTLSHEKGGANVREILL